MLNYMASFPTWNKRLNDLESKLSQAQNDFDSLKMAKMLHVTDEDVEAYTEEDCKAH